MKEKIMFRSHLLIFAVLSSCTLPLIGMNPQDTPAIKDDTEAAVALSSGALLKPTIESIVLATLIRFSSSIMYFSTQEALGRAIDAGKIVSMIGLPTLLFVYCFGIALRELGAEPPHINPDKRHYPGFFQWKQSRPEYLLYTALLIGISWSIQNGCISAGLCSY